MFTWSGSRAAAAGSIYQVPTTVIATMAPQTQFLGGVALQLLPPQLPRARSFRGATVPPASTHRQHRPQQRQCVQVSRGRVVASAEIDEKGVVVPARQQRRQLLASSAVTLAALAAAGSQTEQAAAATTQEAPPPTFRPSSEFLTTLDPTNWDSVVKKGAPRYDCKSQRIPQPSCNGTLPSKHISN